MSWIAVAVLGAGAMGAGASMYTGRGRRGEDIQEDIFEQYTLPYMQYQQRTFWPVAEQLRPLIQERLREEPEDYFRLAERMGREQIGARTGEGIRLAREAATQGQMGGGAQAEMIAQIVRGGAESESELARNLILASFAEKRARIGEAAAFAGRPTPAPTGLSGMARGGGDGEAMGYFMGQLAKETGGAAGYGTEKLMDYLARRRTSEQTLGGGGFGGGGLVGGIGAGARTPLGQRFSQLSQQYGDWGLSNLSEMYRKLIDGV